MRRFVLPFIPLLLALAFYLAIALAYEAHAPGNRIVPAPWTLWAAVQWALTPMPMTGDLPLMVDTLASLARLFASLFLAGIITMVLALLIFSSDTMRRVLHPTIVVLSRLPAIALLPLLLVWVGFGEPAKIALVVAGITPVMIEQLVDWLDSQNQILGPKVRAMGLPLWQQWLYVWIPLMASFFIGLIQSVLGAAWLFLLVAESFGTSEGLGYRIFVLRARLWMDIILVYVFWIGVLAVALYYALGVLKRHWAWRWR